MTNTIINAKIASPYSEALFQLGLGLYLKENNPNLFFQIIFDIQDLLTLLRATPVLQEYLVNPLISSKNKKVILEKCLREETSLHTKNFLNLLVDQKRIEFVEIIAQTFMDKAYEFVCLKFVEICSTYELSKAQQKALIRKLRVILGPEVTGPDVDVQYPNIALSLRVDKDLLGGFVIKIGSKIIDLSLKGELQELSKQLNVTA
nr:ATP synthase CF1, subunit delta [Ishige okamurae]